MTETEAHRQAPKVTTDEYFGGCPECGKSSGYLNVRGSHYGTCADHRVYWPIGYNLFSLWREEAEDEWRQNAALLLTYCEVKPIYAA